MDDADVWTARRDCARFPAVLAGLMAALVVLGAACTGSRSDGPKVAAQLEVIAQGFAGPTQIAEGPDGLVLVAQLAGGENTATGEVVALDPASGTRRVLLEGLDKPTGVLWRPGELWVMVRRGLVRAEWRDSAAKPGPIEVVIDDLPFNDRSEGTLTPLEDGRFLYETSGMLNDGEIVEGSGMLWVFDPADRSSRPIAKAVKNAYAHVVLADGRIVTTDVGDNVDDPPVEELDVITLDGVADLGWPRCPGDRTCDGVVRPLAVFPKSATPTGVAASGDDVYVTLFVTGQLMRVPLRGWTEGGAPVRAVEVVTGLDGPHTVLARPDGSLWITEHGSGRILSLRP